MSVLVTGGAGFVGSTLVRRLLARGEQVVVLDNYLSGRAAHVEDVDGPLTVIEGDVNDAATLRMVFGDHRPERVYHLVGDTFVPSAYHDPMRFVRVNIEGTLSVLSAAARFGVARMLYVSSTEVYGRRAKQPIAEDAPLDPVNTYAVTKLAADRLCYTFFHEHGLPVVIARIFNCYGPRETQPYIVPEIIRQLARSPVVRLGDADVSRDFTFVEDTADGLVALMHSGLPDGEAFNVGSGVSVGLRDLVQRCARIMDVGEPSIATDARRLRRLDIEDFRCDATALREATGWAPTVPLDEGLARTIAWFEANGRRWTWEDWCEDGVI